MAAYQVSSCLSIQVYALFGKPPFAEGARIGSNWEEITDYVMSLNTKSGRSNFMMDFPPATAKIILKNQDRRFDPSFTTGAYAASGKSKVTVGVRIRIIANYTNAAGTIKLGLYDGHAIDWKQKFDMNGNIMTCELKCADRTFLMQNFRYIATRSAETPLTRFVDILTEVSESASATDYSWAYQTNIYGTGFAAGNTLAAKTYSESALEAMRQVCTTAVTNFRMSQCGQFTAARLPFSTTMGHTCTRFDGFDSLVTLDPTQTIPPTASSTGVAYQDVRFSSNLGKTINEVRFAQEGTTAYQYANNADNFAVNGVQSVSWAQSLYTSAGILWRNATIMQNAYRDAELLVDQVSIDLETDTYIPAVNSAWDKFFKGIIGEETNVSSISYGSNTYLVDFNTLTVSIPMPDGSTETIKGLRSGIELSLNRLDPRFNVKVNIEPISLARVWALGKVGFSEIGDSTVLTIP